VCVCVGGGGAWRWISFVRIPLDPYVEEEEDTKPSYFTVTMEARWRYDMIRYLLMSFFFVSLRLRYDLSHDVCNGTLWRLCEDAVLGKK